MGQRTKMPDVLHDSPLPRCPTCDQLVRGEAFEGHLTALLRHIDVMLAPDSESAKRKASAKVLAEMVEEMRVYHDVWEPGPWLQ